MLRMSSGLVAIVILLFSGLCHGLLTARWVEGDGPTDMNPVLAQVPNVVGDWQGAPLEEYKLQSPGYQGWLARRYTNRRTRDSVTILLMCGPPGLVSIHTPDVCYGASGYEVEKPTRHSITLTASAEEAVFYAANLVKSKSAESSSLRIYWAWNNAAGPWTVSDNPRLTFAGRQTLYKLYVIRDITGARPPQQEPCVDFLRAFLPEAQRVLFER
jgi:hypothetical protein